MFCFSQVFIKLINWVINLFILSCNNNIIKKTEFLYIRMFTYHVIHFWLQCFFKFGLVLVVNIPPDLSFMCLKICPIYTFLMKFSACFFVFLVQHHVSILGRSYFHFESYSLFGNCCSLHGNDYIFGSSHNWFPRHHRDDTQVGWSPSYKSHKEISFGLTWSFLQLFWIVVEVWMVALIVHSSIVCVRSLFSASIASFVFSSSTHSLLWPVLGLY